jgi:FAD/FMN-containing dehydrogenase
MSKVSTYLQEHIQGEVSTNAAVLDALSTDASVLKIVPEMVVYPRVTSDIRKVARFAWQLAEKGHVLAITARGSGADQTGAAIGAGIMLVLPAHMNRIFELDAKQKLVRLQPGVSAKALHEALSLQGLTVPALPASVGYATIGGLVASNSGGELSGRYGAVGDWVHQLEVVTANGDVLQTGRISKRELNKKKGLQTFEGEIYRELDNLITDNQQIINEKLGGDVRDNVGYCAITQVKRRDGSFDLTPLFAGSQGTLGIISEMIMRADFLSTHMAVAAVTFASSDVARDAMDQLRQFEPTFLEYIDSAYFELAAEHGKTYDFYKNAGITPQAVLLLGFNDFSERSNMKKLKKLAKLLKKQEGISIQAASGDEAAALLAVRQISSYLITPDGKDKSAPPLFDGAYVPAARFEDFLTATKDLATKFNVTLPIYSRVLEGLIFTRPVLQLGKVADKQKALKLLDEYATVVNAHSGHLIGDGGEGRLKANAAYKALDADVIELFTKVKTLFDPQGILNPGVKQASDTSKLVSRLRPDYGAAQFAQHVPYF